MVKQTFHWLDVFYVFFCQLEDFTQVEPQSFARTLKERRLDTILRTTSHHNNRNLSILTGVQTASHVFVRIDD